MSHGKVAVSWADVLLIVALTLVGSGVCVVTKAGAHWMMAQSAPRESQMRGDFRIPDSEMELNTAKEQRGFVVGEWRQLELKLMRDTASLRMLLDEMTAMPSGARRDSAERARLALRRSITADSLMAAQLVAQKPALDTAVAILTRKHASLSDSLTRELTRANTRHAMQETALGSAVAVIVVALLLLLISRAWRAGQTKEPALHPRLVLPAVASLILLFLLNQVGGIQLALGVGALLTIVLLYRNVRHA